MPRLGVYIHWPFCRSKCPYCDFFSRVKKDVDQAAIVDGYLADLEYYRGLNDGYTVDSVFFGGGTPSLLEPKQIARILDKIAALWPLSEQPEISLEANPNTDRPGRSGLKRRRSPVFGAHARGEGSACVRRFGVEKF